MASSPVQRDKLPAAWVEFLNTEEFQRLSVIDERLKRKKATIADLTKERRAIMVRCVKRMRRAHGKGAAS